MKRLGVLCARVTLPAVLAAVIMTAGEHIVGAAPVKSALAPTGFVWGDRVFTSKPEFDRWLRARGSSYERWEERHPAAAAQATTTRLPPQLSGISPPDVVKTTPQNTLFLTLGVAGFVALSLAFALFFRHMRLAVLRPMLAPAFRGTPAVATGGGGAVTPPAGTARRRRRARRSARETRPRSRAAQERARTAFVAVKTVRDRVAVATRIHDPNLPQPPWTIRARVWLWRLQGRHPELGWYVVACSFAVAVGVAIPLLVR